MKHKSLGRHPCPIARSLDRVGEWWSILILRDAFLGLRRFDEFSASLKIAPNMLSRRLTSLVKSGLLERSRYCDRPPRYEYVLTAAGRDFLPVISAFVVFGNKHCAPEGHAVTVIDTQTGTEAEPVWIDRVSGEPMQFPRFRYAAGPAASAAMQQRYARAARNDAQSFYEPGARTGAPGEQS